MASKSPETGAGLLPNASFFLIVGLLAGFAVAVSAFSVHFGIRDALRPMVGIISLEIAVVIVFVPFARRRLRSAGSDNAETPHDLIAAGKLVRGRVSIDQYRSLPDHDREIFVAGVIDTHNELIRYCAPAHQKRLLLMSDYAGQPNSRELRDLFDRYIAANPDMVAGIFAANAFEIFLSEAARTAAGGGLADGEKAAAPFVSPLRGSTPPP